MQQQYTTDFYMKWKHQTPLSADIIWELLFYKMMPSAVTDFGCTIGIWLAECKARGASYIHGSDGDWVDHELLEIGVEEFIAHSFVLKKYILKCTHGLAPSICLFGIIE